MAVPRRRVLAIVVAIVAILIIGVYFGSLFEIAGRGKEPCLQTVLTVKSVVIANLDVNLALGATCWKQSGGDTYFIWSVDWGDGSPVYSITTHGTSTTIDPSHSYEGGGNYQVSMTVAGVTTDSKTETITVHPQTGPLTASAHGVIGYVAGHAGTITLSSQVSGGTAPYTYLWIGTPADNIQWRFTAQPTTANPTGVYLEKSGITYVFTLTITDSSDPVQTATATVTEALNNPPKISIQASVKDFDVRFAASLTDGSGVIDPTSYAWDFGDGSTSSEASPSHFYALALTYTVNLSVLDTLGAPAAASKQITIVGGGGGGECLGALSADFMADASSRDGIVNFHAVVTGGTCQYSKYTWTFGDGNVSSVSDPSNVYSASGTYHVTLQVTDSDGNSATGDRDIEVTVLPYCDAHPNVSGCQAPPLPSSNIIAIIVYVVLGVLAAGMLIFGLVMRNWILVILGIALPVILALIIIIGVVPLPMVG